MSLLLFGGAISAFIAFPLYLQFSPKIGNVWYRQTDNGERGFIFSSLFQFYILPFTNNGSIVWTPQNWDLNWICWAGVGGTLGKIFT